jgi:hypothetical protein
LWCLLFHDPILDVMTRLRAARALVTDVADKLSGDGIRGLITKQQIAGAVIDGMEPFRASDSMRNISRLPRPARHPRANYDASGEGP